MSPLTRGIFYGMVSVMSTIKRHIDADSVRSEIHRAAENIRTEINQFAHIISSEPVDTGFFGVKNKEKQERLYMEIDEDMAKEKKRREAYIEKNAAKFARQHQRNLESLQKDLLRVCDNNTNIAADGLSYYQQKAIIQPLFLHDKLSELQRWFTNRVLRQEIIKTARKLHLDECAKPTDFIEWMA